MALLMMSDAIKCIKIGAMEKLKSKGNCTRGVVLNIFLLLAFLKTLEHLSLFFAM